MGGKNIPWAKRLKNVLQHIESEYIIYFLEDFFLMSPVNTNSLSQAFDLIKNDPLIGYIGLKYNRSYSFKDPSIKNSDEPFLNKDNLNTVNRVNSMTALWRREWLLSLIKEHETPWEFEIYASIRSRRTPFKVLIINNHVLPGIFDYEIDIQYGYGITRSSWLPKNKELFDRYDISVDYERLGWYKENVSLSTSSKESQWNLRESLYRLKWYWKKFRKYMNKRYRRYLSLH